MSRTATTRGRLPARVYWVRRSLVLLVALVLVFTIARVLSSFGGDDTSGQATPTAQKQSTTPDHVSGVTLTPTPGAKASVPLSQPTGSCADQDVKVVPDVTVLRGGGAQPLTLEVSTTTGETCTWRVSPDSLALKITNHDQQGDLQRIWSSQDCPGVITTRTVVVRPPEERRTRVKIAWGGHRSVPGCVGGQNYARLGPYRLEAASLGGEPASVQFLIVAPPRPRVTQTPSATASPSGSPSGSQPSGKPSASPSSRATTKSTATAAPTKKATKKPSQKATQKPTRKAG